MTTGKPVTCGKGLGRDDLLPGKAFSAPELAVAAKALLEFQAYKTVFIA
ncbi:hypothetical protein PSCICE_11210 [Pseudomonas cichorii]|nr:hypothetical protein PSCICE_11210 [Pseudomonas cichorii]